MPACLPDTMTSSFLCLPACLPSCQQSSLTLLLCLVRCRHACMPDNIVIPLVSHPAPTYQHAGHAFSHLLNLPACRSSLYISLTHLSFLFLFRHAVMPASLPDSMTPSFLCLPACLPAVIPTILPYSLTMSSQVPVCRHARQRSHTPCISSGAGMPACRTLESAPLCLVRRRHTGMPDDVVIPLVSHPALACRHA